MDPLTEHTIEAEKRWSSIDNDIKELKHDLARLAKDVSELVQAWQAATWLITLIKGAGAISVALAALYALFRGHS